MGLVQVARSGTNATTLRFRDSSEPVGEGSQPGFRPHVHPAMYCSHSSSESIKVCFVASGIVLCRGMDCTDLRHVPG